MRRRKQIITASILLILALSAAYVILSRTDAQNDYCIYVWNRDMTAGEKYDKKMFDKIEISCDRDISFIGEVADLAADHYISRDVKKGDIVELSDFKKTGKDETYPDIKPGNELYTIKVKPHEANGCWLFPGKTINIYLVYPMSTSSQNEESEGVLNQIKGSVHIVEGVKIVKIMDTSGKESDESDSLERLICIQSTRENILLIAAAENQGSIKISADP